MLNLWSGAAVGCKISISLRGASVVVEITISVAVGFKLALGNERSQILNVLESINKLPLCWF